jgi:hypothetical protein
MDVIAPTNCHTISKPNLKITNLLFILFVCCIIGIDKLNAQAYRPEYHQLTGGLVGGINFTQVDGDGYRGYSKMGFTGGGILMLPLGEMDMPIDATMALSMEVLFVQKGAKGDAPIPNTNVLRQDIKLQYAEIPFQLNLYRGPRKSGAGIGLGIGYLASSEETIETNLGTVLKDGMPFHKFDLNFVLTGNIHLWNGFFLSPRFQYSLISVRSNDIQYGGRSQQFNNVMALRLMYLFDRKGR